MTAQLGTTTIKDDNGNDVLALVTAVNEDGTANVLIIRDGASPLGFERRTFVDLEDEDTTVPASDPAVAESGSYGPPSPQPPATNAEPPTPQAPATDPGTVTADTADTPTTGTQNDPQQPASGDTTDAGDPAAATTTADTTAAGDPTAAGDTTTGDAAGDSAAETGAPSAPAPSETPTGL